MLRSAQGFTQQRVHLSGHDPSSFAQALLGGDELRFMQLRLPTERELRRPGKTARRIVDNILEQEGTQESVTLYELCCSRNSRLGAAARKLDCAVMRILKQRRWRGKRQRRR